MIREKVATRLPIIVDLSGVSEGEDLGLEDHVGEAASGEKKKGFSGYCARVCFEWNSVIEADDLVWSKWRYPGNLNAQADKLIYPSPTGTFKIYPISSSSQPPPSPSSQP